MASSALEGAAASPPRARAASKRCHVCQSTQFEQAADGGMVCVDCGVRLRGFVEEQADAGVADGGQLRYRVHHKTDVRTTAVKGKPERPSLETVVEAFQVMLQAQVLALEGILDLGDGERAFRSAIRSVWLQCVLRVPAMPKASKARPKITLSRYKKSALAPALSPKLMLALLLIACDGTTGQRIVHPEDLLDWCQSGQLPLLGYERLLPERFRPVLRSFPSVLSMSLIPTKQQLVDVANALCATLGLCLHGPSPRLLIRQMSSQLRLPLEIAHLAEAISLVALEDVASSRALRSTGRKKKDRPFLYPALDVWDDAAAVLFIACKLRVDLASPMLDLSSSPVTSEVAGPRTGHPQGISLNATKASEPTPATRSSPREAQETTAAQQQPNLSQRSMQTGHENSNCGDKLWKVLQPSLTYAVFGCPRLRDSLWSSLPSELKGESSAATSAAMTPLAPSCRSTSSAPTTHVVPWNAVELLTLAPELRCAHAQFCATTLMSHPDDAGLFDEQKEALREFEAMGGHVLSSYSDRTVTNCAASRPQTSRAVEIHQQSHVAMRADESIDAVQSSVLGRISIDDAAAAYIRSSSLPASVNSRYALLLRALAVVAHTSASKLDSLTETLENAMFPMIKANTKTTEKRRRPWDADQLMACMA